MTVEANERWRQAVSRHLDVLAAAQRAVDAKCPRTRYPWPLRLWWRVVGTPAAVRAQQHREGKRRAELFMAESHAHRGEAESPWKTASRERWDADHGEGDYDRRLREAAAHRGGAHG